MPSATSPPCPRAADTSRTAAQGASGSTASSGVDGLADAADLATSIEGLSAAHVGRTSWMDLVSTGAVHATSADAFVLADTLFTRRPLPSSGTSF